MWIVVTRPPLPDMPYWPGRRGLALADAVVWPALLVLGLRQLPAPTGVVVPVGVALTVLWAISRMHRAWLLNHRYRFTTWLVARALGILWLTGVILKLMIAAA